MNTFITEINNTEYLAVSTGLKTRAFKGVNTSRMKSEPGFIIHGEDIKEWIIEGYKEIEGIMYFYGPAYPGTLLDSITDDNTLTAKLIESFRILGANGYKTEIFNISSVFVTDGGALLFFPPSLTDFINSNTSESEKQKLIFPWNNPELKGEEAVAFTITAIFYKNLTGDSAFNGKRREDFSVSMKRCDYSSPLLKQPALRKEIEQLISRSFRGNGNIDDWMELLPLIESGNITDDSISTEDMALISSAVLKEEKKRVFRRKRTEFLRNNRVKIIAAAISLTLLLSIIVPMITRALAAPVTVGMSQAEVVELYYNSFNSADFETMEDCITKQAGDGDIDQALSYTAIIKVRTAYEGPVDGESERIWELSNISITAMPESDTFSIEYDRRLESEIFKVRDIVHLSEQRKAWKIDMLDRQILTD